MRDNSLHVKVEITRYSDWATCVHTYSYCVCNIMRNDSSTGLLDEFDQHATGLHICIRRDQIAHWPITISVQVDVACATTWKPPTGAPVKTGAVEPIRAVVIIAVWGSEHLPVGDVILELRCHQGIAGVSAVPGHRQSVLTNLITDGERRVFSRVPQLIRSTLELRTDTR